MTSLPALPSAIERMSKQTITLGRIKQANDFIGRQPGIGFV